MKLDRTLNIRRRSSTQAALGIAVMLVALARPTAQAVSVRDFGARGDGVTDDTAAVQRAVAETTDGTVEFPRGDYRITATVRVALEAKGPVSLRGLGVGRVIMAGAGPAFHFIGTHRASADPKSFRPGIMPRERMPQVDGLEIVGAHAEADGLEFSYIMQPIIRSCLIRDLRRGIHFTPGVAHPPRITTSNRNVLIVANHIYNCSENGVLFDSVDLHQIIINDNHISYCKRGGIKIVNSAIRDLQIVGNDIEYNHDLAATESADVWFDVRQGSVREGVITGNTIQAIRTPGGANIRFVGNPETPNKVGLWSITGNHLSSQEVNVHLKSARGVSITGNSFLRGGRQSILLESCRNIVVGANSIDNNPDYQDKEPRWLNGVTIRGSEGILINGLQSDGSMWGSPEEGGALEILGSRNVTVAGSQILEPKFRGLYIKDSTNVQVTGTLITARSGQSELVAGIEIAGASEKIVLGDNIVPKGTRGDVVGR